MDPILLHLGDRRAAEAERADLVARARQTRRTLRLLLATAVAGCATLLAPPPSAEAQLAPGDRVRVTGAEGRTVGRVEAAGADYLRVVSPDGSVLLLPAPGVRKVEVSRGRSHWLGARRGARIGALAGAVTLGAVVFLGDPDCDYCLRGGTDGDALAGAALGAVLGGAAGGITGGVLGVERWEPVRGRGIVISLALPR